MLRLLLVIVATVRCTHALGVSRPAMPLRVTSAALRTPDAPRLAAAVDDVLAATARTSLLAEVAKPQRSIPEINAAVKILEAAPRPAKAKKAVQGDWKLIYASDEAAVQPFTTGSAGGPFNVLEDVYHRILADSLQSVEVVRKIGPFGNSAQALCGKWSVAGDGKGSGKGSSKKGEAGEAPAMTWRVTYRIDERGREVDPPKDLPTSHAAVATHVSKELLVLRVGSGGAGSPSYCVFSKTKKADILKVLENEWNVYGPENYLI